MRLCPSLFLRTLTRATVGPIVLGELALSVLRELAKVPAGVDCDDSSREGDLGC